MIILNDYIKKLSLAVHNKEISFEMEGYRLARRIAVEGIISSSADHDRHVLGDLRLCAGDIRIGNPKRVFPVIEIDPLISVRRRRAAVRIIEIRLRHTEYPSARIKIILDRKFHAGSFVYRGLINAKRSLIQIPADRTQVETGIASLLCNADLGEFGVKPCKEINVGPVVELLRSRIIQRIVLQNILICTVLIYGHCRIETDRFRR